MQENSAASEILTTSTNSTVSQDVLPSESWLLAIPSAQLCGKCGDLKKLARIKREEEIYSTEHAPLDEADQKEELRGTESTDTIVAFSNISEASEEEEKTATVSQILLADKEMQTVSIESIKLPLTINEPKLASEDTNSQKITIAENAGNVKIMKSLEIKDRFGRYGPKMVTSLTDLDMEEDESLPYVVIKSNGTIKEGIMDDVEIRKAVNEIMGFSNISSVKESAENQEFNAANNETKDPAATKKSVTFDKSYQPVFQMQPEIVPINVLSNDQQFVFGSAKISQDNETKKVSPRESLVLLRKSIDSLKNREYNSFADNIFESASKLSAEKIQRFEGIKRRISEADIYEKVENLELKVIESVLKEIEEELENILFQDDQLEESDKRFLVVIQKFYDILSMLFGQFHDKMQVNDMTDESNAQGAEVLESNTESMIEQPLEPETADPTVPETSSNEEQQEIVEEMNTDEVTVDGKKFCKCFSVNNELDTQNDQPVYDTEMKTAKSLDLDVLEEDNAGPIKPYGSLISTTISDSTPLRKVKNVDDLSKAESSTNLKSQSFVHSKDFEEHPVELQTKFPLDNKVVNVSVFPTVITRHSHTERASALVKSLLTESTQSIKCESMSTAIIEDLNDDGYSNLLRVPSSDSSEASSCGWIDENVSFENQDDQKVAIESEPKLSLKAFSFQNSPLNAIQENSPCSLVDEAQASTSGSTEPIKTHKRFCRCKSYVKRLISNSFLRKKDRN